MSKNKNQITLDLSDYSHVKSDGYSTHLKHKHGHTIKIAHKMLDKDTQDTLQAFACGGKVQKMAEGGGVLETLPKAPPGSPTDGMIIPEDMGAPLTPDQQAIALNNRVHSVVGDPSNADLFNYVMGGGQTMDQTIAEAQDRALVGMGSLGKVKVAPDLNALNQEIKMVTGAEKFADKTAKLLEEGRAARAAKKAGTTAPTQAPPAAPMNLYAEPVPATPATMPIEPTATSPAPQGVGYTNYALDPATGAYVRAPKKFAEGGDVPEALSPEAPAMAPMQLEIPQVQLPEAQPDPNAKYKQLFETALADQKRNNPGDSPAEHERIALEFAARHKQQDEYNAKAQAMSAQSQAQGAQAKAQAMDAKRQMIGLPTTQPQMPQPPISPLESSVMPQAQPEPQGPTAPMDLAADSQQSGYNKVMKGINDYAAAQAGLADQQAQILKSQQLAAKEAEDTFMQQYQGLEAERQAHIEDIEAGYIDPQAYWKDHSKVMAGIGMILAGFNPTTQPNAAVQFIQKQMDNNLEAQKANLASKQNLLSANLRQFGNLKDAVDMTRIMQNDLMARELQIASAKAANPMAKAAALQASGKFQMEAAEASKKFAVNRTLSTLQSQANQDPSKIPALIAGLEAVDPKRAEEIRMRYIPGMGLANSAEGAKVVRDTASMTQTALSGIKRLEEISKITGKSLMPGLISEADTIRSSLIGALRVPITGPGAMSEPERAQLMALIPDPTSILSYDPNTRTRLQTLAKRLQVSTANAAAVNGLKSAGQMPSQGATMQSAPRFSPRK